MSRAWWLLPGLYRRAAVRCRAYGFARRGTHRAGENDGMRITVLGTGVVGRTLAARLDGLGHDVVIGTRDPADTMARTEPGGFGTPPYPQWQAEHPGVRLLSFADAAGFAELLFNATSGGSAMAVLVAAGEPALVGKVLIDVSNPAGLQPRHAAHAGPGEHRQPRR